MLSLEEIRNIIQHFSPKQLLELINTTPNTTLKYVVAEILKQQHQIQVTLPKKTKIPQTARQQIALLDKAPLTLSELIRIYQLCSDRAFKTLLFYRITHKALQ
ncbi:hypothetical protein KKG22_03815 [Patescibacteria group bacterium]|nr:hypothetical protein [Patescibacteria group bacterium]